MKPELIEFIKCPRCRGVDLRLETVEMDQREVRSGAVCCNQCRKAYEIRKGILYLFDTLPETVVQEKEQTALSIADRMQRYRFDSEWLLKLPVLDDDELGLGRLLTFEEAISLGSVPKDAVVLDFGCGSCWTTWRLAEMSRVCIALDTCDHSIHGLGTFDAYAEAGRPYFERVVGDLNQLSFRKGTFDLIFTSASVHHAISVKALFERIRLLLKPGGRFIMINEPVCSIFKTDTSLQQEARENLASIEKPYSIFQYRRFARRAGFHETFRFEWFNYRTKTFHDNRALPVRLIKKAAVSLWRHPGTRRRFRQFLHGLAIMFGADYGTRGWPVLGRINFFMILSKPR